MSAETKLERVRALIADYDAKVGGPAIMRIQDTLAAAQGCVNAIKVVLLAAPDPSREWDNPCPECGASDGRHAFGCWRGLKSTAGSVVELVARELARWKHNHSNRHVEDDAAQEAARICAITEEGLREALEDIAKQRLSTEIDQSSEEQDFEGGYDECVKRARAALAPRTGKGGA